MSILITGGAGVIGSHTAKLLYESGLDIVIPDNLITGRRGNVRRGAFVEGDIADKGLVRWRPVASCITNIVASVLGCEGSGLRVIRETK